MNRFLKTLSLAAAGLGGLTLSAEALIIKVFDPKGGSDYAGMQTVVEDVRVRLAQKGSIPLEINGYSIVVAEGNVMTSNLSLAPGSTAVFWSDKGVRYESGFSQAGGRATLQYGEIRSAQAPKGPALARAPQDRLSGLTIAGSRLTLRYSLAAPGPVKVELFTAKGAVLQRWKWTESAAGAQSKTLDIGKLGQGRHFIRWSNGNYRAVRQLAPSTPNGLK